MALLLTLGAAILAMALNHLVEMLARWHIRRGVAIALVVAGTLALIVSLGVLLIPAAVSQARALATEAPALWQRLQHTRLFLRLDQRFDLQQQAKQLSDKAAGAITPMLAAASGLFSGLAALITLTVLTIFVLIFAPGLIRDGLDLLRPHDRSRAERLAKDVYRSVGGYVGGLLGICALNATLTTIFLAIVRMPFFLPFAILSGLSSLVPYAGPLVAGVSITLVVLVSGGAWKALATAIYFVLYGQLEGNLLGPVIYRRTAHVNPLVTTLAILFLAEFMGLPGAIIAVPVAAAAQILLREILAVHDGRQANEEHPDGNSDPG